MAVNRMKDHTLGPQSAAEKDQLAKDVEMYKQEAENVSFKTCGLILCELKLHSRRMLKKEVKSWHLLRLDDSNGWRMRACGTRCQDRKAGCDAKMVNG